jgi:hypothetical protein
MTGRRGKHYVSGLSACVLVGALAVGTLAPSSSNAKAARAAHTAGCVKQRGVLYCTDDVVGGTCVLHPAGALGTRPDTISTPALRVTNIWKTAVTAKRWTHVIRTDTGQRLPGYGSVWNPFLLARGRSTTYHADTLNIPPRPLGDYFYVRVQVVVRYTARGRLVGVDTVNVVSYWLYQDNKTIPDNIPVAQC